MSKLHSVGRAVFWIFVAIAGVLSAIGIAYLAGLFGLFIYDTAVPHMSIAGASFFAVVGPCLLGLLIFTAAKWG